MGRRYRVEVAPARERGLKFIVICMDSRLKLRRSREGAWIEIAAFLAAIASFIVAPARERGLKWKVSALTAGYNLVAPARERGLKSCGQCLGCRLDSRSREGAWIEIGEIPRASYIQACRSREGAWIEIRYLAATFKSWMVAPARERGLKLLR